MPASSKWVASLEQVTNEWLTAVLTHSGGLTQGSVAGFDMADAARGGSSTMAQKRNPVKSELIVAAARHNASLLAQEEGRQLVDVVRERVAAEGFIERVLGEV